MKIKGYNIYGPIVPYSDLDKYPTHIAKYGKGGYISVNTVAEFSLIPKERLEEGMLGFAVEDNTNIHFYQYLGGAWTKASFSNEITSTTNLDEFKENSAPGSIVVYENKLYQTVLNENGEREVQPLPIYEVKETKVGKVYGALFSGDTEEFAKDSDITLNCASGNKSLKISDSVKLKFGDKTITAEETENSISLPSSNGVLALEKDVEEKYEEVKSEADDLSIELGVERNRIDNLYRENSLNERGINGKTYTRVSQGKGKFLTIKRQDLDSQGMILAITGKYLRPGQDDKGFSDILGLSIGKTSRYDNLYYLDGRDASESEVFWYYKSTAVGIELYVKSGIDFTAKIIQNTLSQEYYTWENTLVQVSDEEVTIPATSFIESSKTTINKLEPKVQVFSYDSDFTDGNSKDQLINVVDFNTFVINSNGYSISGSEDSYVLKINKVTNSEEEKNIAFKIIVLNPKKDDFNFLKIKYDGEEVLNLKDLKLQDGEGIYVTYKESGDWAYFRESTMPNHDDTLKVEVDEDGKSFLSVAQSSSNEEKIYEVNFTTLNDSNSGIKIYVDSNRKINLEIPEDAGVLMIDVTGLYTKAHSIDSDVTENLFLRSIKSSSATEFKQGKILKLIFSGSNDYSVKFEASTAFSTFSTNGHFYGCEQNGDAVVDIYTEGWRYRSYLPDNTLEFGYPSNNKISGTTVEVLSVLDKAGDLGWIYYSTDYIPQITLEEIKVMTDYIKDEFKIEQL